MKRRFCYISMIMMLLIIAVLSAGCKKDKDGQKTDKTDTAAVTKGAELTGQPALTTPTESPSPTPAQAAADEPSPTPEDEPVPTLSDMAGVSWRKWSAPQGIVSANLYDSFLKGEVKVTAEKENLYITDGEYDLEGLLGNMSANLKDYYMPYILTEAKYAILDCGSDNEPELGLLLVFDNEGEYSNQATEYVVIKDMDGTLKVVECFQSYYRCYASINSLGYVQSGGSTGAMTNETEYYFINSEGEKVIDYIDDLNMEFTGLRIPGHLLPGDLVEKLSEYGGDDDYYNLDIIGYKPFEWDGIIADDYTRALKQYYSTAVFVFSDRRGNYVLPDEEYVNACEKLGLKIVTMDEQEKITAEHRKETGLTDEIINAADPEWIDINALSEYIIKNGVFGNDAGKAEDVSGDYGNYLGMWYLIRSEVDGDESDAEEMNIIQYMTFYEDYTAEKRIDYSLDDYSIYDGDVSTLTGEDGPTGFSVTYWDRDYEVRNYSINDEGILVEEAYVLYEDGTGAGVRAEYSRTPFWGEEGYYYELKKPVMPDILQSYIDNAKENEWLIALTDPDEEIIRACEDGRWELHDESENGYVNRLWTNPKEMIIINCCDKAVDIEVHEPAEGYDTKSSGTGWEAGPFYYWDHLEPGELSRMIVDIPDKPEDATGCLYMEFEGNDSKYFIRIYRFDPDDPYITFGE